jgi:hypothetical protein
MKDPKRKAIPWTEKLIKDQSAISPSEVERAKVFWSTNADKESKDLLDAITE